MKTISHIHNQHIPFFKRTSYPMMIKSVFISSIFLLCFFSAYAQTNLVVNGDFESGDLTGWNNFNNQNLVDDFTNSRVGNVNNGEGSLFQILSLNPGTTYQLQFDYRWVSGSGNYNMNATIRDNDTGGTPGIIFQETLDTDPDVWHNASIEFTVPEDVSNVRILFFKGNGNRPFRLDNVVLYNNNLIKNGDFEVGEVGSDIPEWNDSNNQVLDDDITNSQVGNINNGEGSLFQEFFVNPNETYDVQFDYRWRNVGGDNSNMTVRLRDANNLPSNLNLIESNQADGYILDSELDIWKKASFSFSPPDGITEVRLLFYKDNGNKPLRLDNVIVKPRRVFNPSTASQAAFFTWDASYCSDGDYDWVVVEKGNDPDIIAEHVASGNTTDGDTFASVSGLTDEVEYEFYVNNNCDASDAKVWEIPRRFTTRFQGNLIQNSRFTLNNETPSSANWEGFNPAGQRVDNITGEFVGFIDNEGTLRQDIKVVPGIEYLISFNYRWFDSGRSNGNSINPQIRNPNIVGGDGILQPLPLSENDSNTWYTAYFSYTHPLDSPLDSVRLQFYKVLNTNQLHINNVTVLQNIDLSTEANFVYENGIWTPSDPIANSTNTQNVLIFNGRAKIDGRIDANNIIVKPWADVDVEDVLSVESELTIEDGGVLTFKSTETNSGQLEKGTVVGNVTVERYIPAETNTRRAFRYVTSAVTTTNGIYNHWQEGGRNFIDKYGTHITGSQTGENGLDATETGFPSMFWYDTVGNDWEAITNTQTTNLEAGKGYILMIRGDRQHDLSSNPANIPNSDVILRAKGNLLTDNQSFNLNEEAESFTLVGNPYQAVVDLSTVTKVNIYTNFYWVWDANMSTRGAYVAVDLINDNNFDVDGSQINPAVANRFVQPGQSFFIQTENEGTASITFSEDDKNVDELITGIFSEEQNPKLRAVLFTEESFTNGKREADAIQINFSANGNNDVNLMDATKFANPDENFAILNESDYLSIENRALPTDDEHIELYTAGYLTSNYIFVFQQANFPENTTVYLVDNYTNQEILLDVSNSTYQFQVDTSLPESIATNRFSIKFEVGTLGSTEYLNENQLAIYPNPSSSGLFTIQSQDFNNQQVVLELYDTLGKKVMQSIENASTNGTISVDASQLQSGIYVVQIQQDNFKWTSKLIIK